MSLMDKVNNDIKEAMKSKQQERLDALRMLKAEFIKNNTAAKPTDELSITVAHAKRLQDSLEMYGAGTDAHNKIVKELNEHHVAAIEPNKQELKENEQTYDYLEEALNELHEEQRQCVILFYLKKNSYQQISEKTGYDMMQVKSYIQNGKRNLKIILDRKIKEKKAGKNE